MAQNKYALIRYKVLDHCFRNTGKRYFIDDLISACEEALCEINPDSNGISRRQIYEDIAFMESKEGWEIELLREREGKKYYYRYADSNFSINQMPLNETELTQLKSAMTILSQFTGMPQFDWIQELLPKLQQGMSQAELPAPIMAFDNNSDLKGIAYLGPLYQAIYYRKVLRIRYQPFVSDAAFDVELHPYFLKQYNNRWFLFGYNPEKDKLDWNLALDRIVEMTEISKPYVENHSIDWNDYFEDMIGVTKWDGAAPQDVVLHVKGITGKYIESKPMHGSQKHRWLESDTLEVRLNLIINYELERLILSYADAIHILSPQELRERVLGRVNGIRDVKL